MERIEAGTTPPLNPRELQSRPSALRSRAHNLLPKSQSQLDQQFQTALMELSPNPYRYPLLLEKTHQYLQEGTGQVLPDRLPTVTPDIVALAGNNGTKLKGLEDIVKTKIDEDIEVMRISKADELPVPDVLTAAKSKLDDGMDILLNPSRRDEEGEGEKLREAQRQNKLLISAVDVRLGILREEDGYVFKSFGKPTRAGDETSQIQGNFKQLADIASKHELPEIPYGVEHATVIVNPNDPEDVASSVRKVMVFLKPDVLRYLATEKGYETYQAEVKKVLGEEREPHQIAAGLELQVLRAFGAIARITSTPFERPENVSPEEAEKRFQQAYDLALGKADPELVEAFCAKLPRKEEGIKDRDESFPQPIIGSFGDRRLLFL